MNYWILKSEPDVYGYETLEKDKKGVWDGVRNYQARNNLKAMKIGDLALFYHSNIGKEVVGIIKITKESYQDPTTTDTNWVVVEVEPFRKLKKAVPLSAIKNEPMLQDILLVRNGRISVSQLKKEEFDRIIELSEVTPFG